MAQAAEAPAIEFISEKDFLKRPLVTGLAVDPADPYEIDDAIHAETNGNNKYEYRIQKHVADAGLLYKTSYVDVARQVGWSEYPEDGSPPTLMLPEQVALHGLSLNTNHHGTGTAPALTIEYTFRSDTRTTHDVEVYKSRIDCEAIDYDEFGRRMNMRSPSESGNPDIAQAALLRNRARELNAAPSEFDGLSWDGLARSVIRHHAKKANVLIAEKMHEIDKINELWIFRTQHNRQPYPNTDIVRHLYPDSALLDQLQLAWYSRLPSPHDQIDEPTFCHFTSPLRRFPDLVNHLTLHAHMKGLPLPYTAEELDEIARELARKMLAQKAARLICSSALLLTQSAWRRRRNRSDTSV